MSLQERKEKTEKFYMDAFCAKKATIVLDNEMDDFIITGVVKLETGDKRGTIYIAGVKRK